MYKTRYEKFISTRTVPSVGYTELHHIIPRCMGGDDTSTNLIQLTAREHFIAHWMLWKAYPEHGGLAQAFLMMQNNNSTQERYKLVPSIVYENARRDAAIHQSELYTSFRWWNNGTDQCFQELCPDGWESGRLMSDDLKIDIFAEHNGIFTLVYNATSTKDALQYMKSSGTELVARSVKGFCDNARLSKGSKYGQFHLAYAGDTPIKKVPNTKPGSEAAVKANTGKKRPGHAAFMKNYNAENGPLYIIPEGTFSLAAATEFYGRDMLIDWCRNNPDKIITKMMIVKSKKLSMEDHASWIGQTRKQVGFGYTTN